VCVLLRPQHPSLSDLDTGLGFDSQIVVKVNAPQLLRSTSPRAAGTASTSRWVRMFDCYQRAEGRYS